MNRKTIMIFTVLFTLFSISNLVFAEPKLNLTDINNHWAKDNIETLVKKGAINGYEDNTFRPDDIITTEEFIKMFVSLLHDEQEIIDVANEAGYVQWVLPYLTIAIRNNYLKEGEVPNLSEGIKRSDIALMISRAMDEEPENIDKLREQIKDIERVLVDSYYDLYIRYSSEATKHMARVYAAGIITGYGDGTFKPNKTATRAEATTILTRFLDESKRQIPQIKANYPEVTELFERELLSDYVGDKGVIEHRVGNEYQRVEYVYKIQKSDLPLKVGKYVLYSIEDKFEIIGDYRIPYITLHQTVIGNAYSYRWSISKDNEGFYRGLHMNIANKDYGILRSRNNYSNFTYDFAKDPIIDEYGNEIYKTYYGIIVDGLPDWKTYRGEDAYHLIFNDSETNYAVIVENAFNK